MKTFGFPLLTLALWQVCLGEGSARDWNFINIQIDGHHYYLDRTFRFESRADAIEFCTFKGMSLVALETAEKWYGLKSWIENDIQYGPVEYWTDAVKNNSAGGEWIWGSSGQPITEFFWAPDQPSMDASSESLAISFHALNGGFFDRLLEPEVGLYRFGVTCELFV